SCPRRLARPGTPFPRPAARTMRRAGRGSPSRPASTTCAARDLPAAVPPPRALLRPRAETPPSIFPQAVDGREAARLRRRIERRQVAERDRDRGDHEELTAVDVHREVADVIHVGIELQPEALDERAGGKAQEEADRRSDGADGQPLEYEDLHPA